MTAITCKNVAKSFGKKTVLEQVSFQVKKGSICALLGRNGAGKTTLLNCLCTKFLPDEGEILVLDEPVYENEKVLSQICFMSDYIEVFDVKSVKSILNFAVTFYKDWNMGLMNRMLNFFGIDKSVNYGSLSKGQQTIVGMIIGLCSNCEIVLLDEIYSGLDAAARQNFYEILLEEQERNPRTFVLSTHLIDEMAGMFTDVVILDKGTVILQEELEELHRKAFRCTGRCEKAELLNKKNVIYRKEMGSLGTYDVYDELTKQEQQELEEAGFAISALSLQELFLAITSDGTKEWSDENGAA